MAKVKGFSPNEANKLVGFHMITQDLKLGLKPWLIIH
jgi:hypothetical protein